MPLIFHDGSAKERARVMLVHSQPEKLTRDQQDAGLSVDRMPEKPTVERGEAAVPYCNPATGDVWYEVEARELSPEEKALERVDALEARLAKAETRLDELESSDIKLR